MAVRPRSTGRAAVPVTACALMACVAETALAQGWPAATPGWTTRGAGGGLAILPVVCWWLLGLGWVATTDWLARDSVRRGFAPAVWVPVAAFSFPVLAVIAWWVPWTWVALLLTAVAWLGPALCYALTRNPKVPKADRVLTMGHAKRIAAPLLERCGIEIETMEEGGDDLLPTVTVRPAGSDPQAHTALMEKVKVAPGLADACKVLQGAVSARAARIRFDVAPDAVHLFHHVDGMWVKPRLMTARGSKKDPGQWGDVPPFSRAAGDAALVVLKAVAGISARGQGRQEASFVIEVDGKPKPCTLGVQLASTGEQVIVEIAQQPAVFKNCADLGMSSDLFEKLSDLLGLAKGVIILSSPQASGLTTTFAVALNAADRLLRDFISIEDAAAPAAEIQNVKPIRYDMKAEQTPLAVLAKALLEYPAAVVTRDLRDPALAVELVRLADEDKLVVLSLKASDAIEAITKLLACKVPVDQLGRSLLGSLSQRLVRRLCPRCRQAFQPPGELLARLKKTPEQVPQLYRASPHGCSVCSGLGYMGRTAIFELASGPTLRKAIASQADPQVLRKAAVQDGMVALRDAGFTLVMEGVTSLEELQRVFAAPAVKKPTATGRRP